MSVSPGAFLLRVVRGGNFMVQTHGIPSKLVQDAITEIVDDFNNHSRKIRSATGVKSRGDEDAYNVSLGQRYALQSKYLVTFRLVDSIMVFYVCEPHTNPIVSLRYVDAAAKILVGVCKGAEISTKRLSKKYATLYLLLGRILGRGIGYLPSAFIHAPPTNEKMLSMPVSASDASRKLKKMAKTKTKNSFVKTSEDVEVVQGEKGDGEVLQKVWDASGHAVTSTEFVIPAGALPAPPSRVMGAKRKPPAPPVHSVSRHAFSGAATADEGDDDETVVEESHDEEEESNLREGVVEDTEATVAHDIPVSDLQEALVMVEVWEGSVSHGAIESACVRGEVRRALAPYNLDKAAFRIIESESLVVDSCLHSASVHRMYAQKNVGEFGARLSSTPIDTSYLRYQLPSSAVDPPLQCNMLVALPEEEKGPAKSMLLVIPFAVNPSLPNGLVDVSVTLSLPPELDGLVKTSHRASFSPQESRIQWCIDSMEAGGTGAIRAILKSSKGIQNRDTTIEDIRAEVLYSGYPGKSYSGLGFEVGFEGDEDGKPYYAGKIRTFGRVSLSAA
ncbi:hypothetical protein PSENEW3_00000261 [Picochlorum sp. SENEW3]|nr:hypothetical protein PSENEW3_00000261 [Picochlorum sp. SENEW3]